MSFATNVLDRPRPASLQDLDYPRYRHYYMSPVDWRDEVLYFLLVDRFSDGREDKRKLLDRSQLAAARPASPGGEPWRWDRWAQSGADRYQGGTLKGVRSKLGYLKKLGISSLWLSPVFKQRGHLDTYHGYGIQDFLEVDPRFGTRQDLVELVAAAHQQDIRVILDVIFNHSGDNWVYLGGVQEPPYTPARHEFGRWIGKDGDEIHAIRDPEDGVWPEELQDVSDYTRAGRGDLGAGDINDPDAEHKRTDFCTLRDFNLKDPTVLAELVQCFKYWIALTDCDGFRIDTVKHVSFEQARNFCGAVKEFAANLGKKNFLLVGEVAGGDFVEDRYLDVLAHNLDAALDIGEMRPTLGAVAKGLIHPRAYFDGFNPRDDRMGSHRNLGLRHISILDDHDHVFGLKLRFSVDASSDHQIVAGVTLQLLTLGIPCIYYGTEQMLAGPEPEERKWLPEWGASDRYLREAMFGPEHPRRHGREGMSDAPAAFDADWPGFGPFGTAGRHCFDAKSPAYVRIAALTAIRRDYPALRYGRQYLRPISFLGQPFDFYGPGEIVAWSRILDDEEMLCVLNAHGTDARGADVLVDAALNPPGSEMTVIYNSSTAANPNAADPFATNRRVPVQQTPDGTAFVRIENVKPSEVIVLTRYPEGTDGGLRP